MKALQNIGKDTQKGRVLHLLAESAGVAHTVVADDVTAGEIEFTLTEEPALVDVSVRTAAGVVKAWDGAAVIDGRTVTVDNTGTTDFADTDVVVIKPIFA